MLKPTDRDPIHYSNRVKELIDALPNRLKADGLIIRLVRQSLQADEPDRLEPLDQRGPLCPLHHKLNADIVKKVFTLLVLEVGAHLNNLAHCLDRLTEEQKQLVLRLRALHVIWYEPGDYEKFFQQKAQNSEWTYQGNKCAACSLARIAGNRRAVLDLICANASRSPSGRRTKSRLYTWLNTWLSHYSESSQNEQQEFVWLIGQNEDRTKALKEMRKALARQRARSRKTSATPPHKGTEQGPTPEVWKETKDIPEYVYEYEHIDDDQLLSVNTHTALLSTPHLPNMDRFSQAEKCKVPGAGRGSLINDNNPDTPLANPDYVPPRANWKTHTTTAAVPATNGRHKSGTSRQESTATVKKRESQPRQPEDTARPDSIKQRPGYRSSDDAAASYANVLSRANPFISGAPMNCNLPATSNTSRTTLKPTKVQTEAESVWTDCPPMASRRSSLSSIMSKYANYGGLPMPPDNDGSRPDKGSQNKPHKCLTPEELVKRSKSTSCKGAPGKVGSKREMQRPPPINIDKRRPGHLAVVEIVKRAASSSTRSKGAGGDRESNDAKSKPKHPPAPQSVSVYTNTLESSNLLPRDDRKERHKSHGKQKTEAADTKCTRWTMGGWQKEVAKKPENKFYQDRLEKETEKPRKR